MAKGTDTMTATRDRVTQTLTDANPHPRESITEPSADPRAQAMLAAILAEPAPLRRVGHHRRGRTGTGRRALALGLSLVVVAAVAAVLLHARTDRTPATDGPDGTTASEIVLRLQPTPDARVTAAAVGQEIQILRARVGLLGVAAGTRFTRDGDALVVHSRALAASPVARALLTRDPQIALTDWEQNLIAPDGRTVASLLPSANDQAELLSQGHAGPPGTPGSGALPLYAAVRLASRQSARADAVALTRRGAEAFAFAPAGRGRCASSRIPCWASGPTTSAAAASRAARRAGVTDPMVLTVHQGTIIVRASEPASALRPDYRDETARYYVMRDDAALTGLDLSRITSSSDGAGQPDVEARMTPAGARAFRALTAAVAHRGSRLRVADASLFQHFAIVIDGALAAVPLVDYQRYPDGVLASPAIQIDGGLSHAGAIRLADTLRLRTLPLKTTIAARH
jgi:preprotein translocase subunit SecD